MVVLTTEEKKELKKFAASSELRKSFRKVAQNRFNPFVSKGKMDIDKYITFLSEFNKFINHKRRPFKKIIIKAAKL